MDKLLWYLIAGTRGGLNRARIISILNERPYNANQIAEKLSLDYKTVKHHLKVLRDNEIISVEGNGYGQMNFLTNHIERHYDTFTEIWRTIKFETEGSN